MRKRVSALLVSAFLSVPVLLSAQPKKKPVPAQAKKPAAEKVYDKAHTPPKPPLGTDELKQYFYERVSRECDMNQITLQCIVNKDGSLSEVKVKEDISQQCLNELKQAAAKMPKWKPGLSSAGKPIRVRYTVDISVPSVVVVGEEIREGTTIDVDFGGGITAPSSEPVHLAEPEPQMIIAKEQVSNSAGTRPEFPDLETYIKQNLVYPPATLKYGTAGVVRVKMMIGANGKVSNVLALSRLPNGCTEEAIRLAENMPAWKPATRNGKSVQSEREIVVRFILPGDYVSQPRQPGRVTNVSTDEQVMTPPAVDMAAPEPVREGNDVFLYVEEQPEFPSRDTLSVTYLYRHKKDKSRTISVPESKRKDVSRKEYKFEERIEKKISYGLMNYLRDNIRYPQTAVEAGVQGRVVVRFVVDRDGSLTDFKVVKGIGMGCDEEAIRVVKNMPRWKPGKQNGQPVKVAFTLPVKFQLE